jgi:hypothetical protein
MRDLARVDFENLKTFTNEIIKLTTKLNVCKDVVVEDVKNYVK